MEFPNRPSAWLPVKLIDIATLNMGQSPSSSDVNDFGEGIVFFQGKAEFGKLHPTARKFCTAPKKIAESGDILLSVRAPVGPTNVANQKTAIGRGLAAIRAERNAVDPRFLLHYFRCIEPWISLQGTGTTFKAVSGAFLKELNAVLPALAEQKVIADKLDTLLAQVENTKARLERIPQILKRFRQSVLAAAVSGRLTGGTFVYLGSLKNVADIVSGVAFKKAQYSNSGSKLLQIANIGYGDTKWDSVSYIPSSLADDFSTYSLAEGDIVMALNRPITNDTLKVAAVSVDDLPATLYQRVARIRSKPELLNSRYLFLLMQSPDFRKKVELNLKGSDQPYLNTSSLGTFEIYAPELEKQTEIVRRVDQLFAHADRIEQQVNNALARVNNLTQSILAKAFRGELTEQWRKDNPELISGENSAEALLERIKAERAAKKTAKRRRKN